MLDSIATTTVSVMKALAVMPLSPAQVSCILHIENSSDWLLYLLKELSRGYGETAVSYFSLGLL